MGWRPALAQVRRDAPYRARGGAARQGPRHAVPGRRQAGGGFCAARPGADALAPRAEGGFRSGGDFQSRPALRRDVMQTGLADFIRDTPEGAEADAILRKCVHCGFCTATCPTYQILGDDLDSPRGRIYLIKRALEGAGVTQRTRLHLDRCLTCRACETTCPSGVRHGRLVDIGRRVVEERTRRTPWDRLQRAAMSFLLPRTGLFAAALSLGRLSRPFLPLALKTKIPAKTRVPGPWPMPRHRRKMLVLGGCVQPALAPGINAAAARVLDRLGVSLLEAPGAGCCGGIRFHLNRQEAGRDDMRAVIDAWWPMLEAGGIEAIVITASGCGVTVKEYGHLLAQDPEYREKAARISALARDLCEVIPVDAIPRVTGGASVAFPPASRHRHSGASLDRASR